MHPHPDTHALPDHPLVSVMVAAHDDEPYLPQCLDSILAQTYTNLDVALLDDGSTDGSPALCDQYAARDPRVRATHVPNGGVAVARNLLLDLARADLLLFVDGDDWIEPNTVARLVQAMLRSGSDMICCSCCMERTNMTAMPATPSRTVVLRGDATLRGRLEDGVVSDTAWGKLVRRDVFRGVRYTADDSFADAAVVRALCTNARWIACIPDVIFHYRLKDTAIAASYHGPDFVEN